MRTRLEQLLRWRESSERWPFYRSFPPLLVIAQRPINAICGFIVRKKLQPICEWIHSKGHVPWAVTTPHGNSCGNVWMVPGRVPLQSLLDPLVSQAIPPGLLAPRQIEPGTFLPKEQNAGKEQNTGLVVIGNFQTRANRLEIKKGTDLKVRSKVSLLSLRLSRRHMDLLQEIYTMPLIAPDELAALLRLDTATLRRYLYDLHHVYVVETMATIYGKRLALTETGCD